MARIATKTVNSKVPSEEIPFRMHPRVFAALGADLVTNNVVAIIELVKNSYDAYAQNVRLRFFTSAQDGPVIEILDDGCGMTREVIENAWFVVATPYKEENPVVERKKRNRRVAGAKGLGRLSVARLGSHLHMLTQSPHDVCWEIDVDWSTLAKGSDLSESYAICRPYNRTSPFSQSGTRIRISGLMESWDEDQVLELEENLSRLMSPFSSKDDFHLFLKRTEDGTEEEIEIEPPSFLSAPKYKITGKADDRGNVKGQYQFATVSKGLTRSKALSLRWARIRDNIQPGTRFRFSPKRAHCGPFEFEIRGWDIGSDDTSEIADQFDLQKSQVRKAIRAHKGISVYRDDVLVLPKSENARDWLGLDLRRISRVGTRMSTNQIVGFVSISADDNPRIEDTSDRERLAARREVAEFEEILKGIVELLENERAIDRAEPEQQQPMEDLFSKLDAKPLLSEVRELSREGASAAEILMPIRNFSRSLSSTRKIIETRFVYYSRLATVGTIAHMLVHEIRNRTIAFGSFLGITKDRYAPFKDVMYRRKYQQADRAVDALERLADTFSPLASRNFRRRQRDSILEEQIRNCLDLHSKGIKAAQVSCHLPNSKTRVAVDPGELDAILLNLITNALYWMSEVPEDRRTLKFGIQQQKEAKRIVVSVRDSGPGIDPDDVEKIFWPGVTRKPGGIGMGLTVAAELVSTYRGKMALEYSEGMSGSTFVFDLPLYVER